MVAWREQVLGHISALLEALGSSRPDLDAELLVAATDGLRLIALIPPPPTRLDRVQAGLERLIGMLIGPDRSDDLPGTPSGSRADPLTARHG